MRFKIAFAAAFLIFLSEGRSQETLTNIDSVLRVLQRAPADTSKALLYQKIGGHYNVVHLDSAKTFLVEGLELSEKLNFPKGKWINLNTLGNYHERKTQYDSAMVFYDRALDIVEELNSTKGFAVVLNNIATIHIRKGDYEKALEFMFRALKAEEDLNNENGIAQAYNNIGVVYYYMQDFDKTTDYLTRALEIQERLGNYDGLINGYNNVGAIFDYLQQYEAALESYGKGLEIAKKIKDRKNEAIQLVNMGLARSKMGQLDQAEDLLKSSLAIREEIQDFHGMATSYIAYAENSVQQGKMDQALNYFRKSLEISEEKNLKLLRKEAYRGMADVYEQKGNYQNAIGFLKQMQSVKDSILNEDNAKIIAEVETRYETEKKEKEILAQRAEIAEGELEIKRKSTLLYGSLGLAFVLGLLGYLLYNQQKLKNRQLQKEGELKAALAKIETQNKLQEQRLRISRDLHDNIGAQLTFIISSIDNLKYGFTEISDKLSDKLKGISRFTSHTIHELRDTIWAMNKNEIGLEDLQARISNFIENAKVAANNVAFQFEVAPDMNSNISFTSIQGMNIYRIIQEAVNNAVKYSEASDIKVNFSEEQSQYVVQIIDNGKGFAMDDIERGNGLHNMNKRSIDLGGSCTIESQPQQGTMVRLEIPKKA